MSESLSPVEPLKTGQNISFAQITLESNGISRPNVDVLTTQSFTTGEQVLPDPKGDVYLNGTIIPITGPGETAAVFTQPPGVLDWHRDHTLTPCAKVLEINPGVGPNGEIGFPYGDINTRLAEEVAINPDLIQKNGKPLMWATTFPGDSSKKAAQIVGAVLIQNSRPEDTSNKPKFREWAYASGVTVAPGITVYNEADLEFAAQYLATLPFGAWMKANGSGGDLVQRIKNVSLEALQQGRTNLVAEIQKAFRAGTFSPEAQNAYMQQGAYAPIDGFAIEADVRNYGTSIANCSNLVNVERTGKITVMGVYGQMTSPEGAFIGSRTLTDLPDVQAFLKRTGMSEAELLQTIQEQSIKAAVYQMEQQHFGLHGQDFFLIEREDDVLMVPEIELNGRPPISGIGEIMKRRAGVEHFINTNIWATHTLNTMDEIRAALTLDGRDLTESDPKEGAIQIQAPRAQWIQQDGRYELIRPSNSVKILFLGNDPEKLDALQNELREKNGLSYTPAYEEVC